MKVSDHISKGNKKLPGTTWIFNAGSATDCPSRPLGLCQCPDTCYALKAEKQYPAVLPYRRRQEEITRTMRARDFALGVAAMANRARNKPTAFRFNEAGDFRDQKQLDWFTEVCGILLIYGIPCYGYTARTDLDLSDLLEVAYLSVSNDEENWIARGANRFQAVSEFGKGYKCAGDCRKCSLCFTTTGITVQVKAH